MGFYKGGFSITRFQLPKRPQSKVVMEKAKAASAGSLDNCPANMIQAGFIGTLRDPLASAPGPENQLTGSVIYLPVRIDNRKPRSKVVKAEVQREIRDAEEAVPDGKIRKAKKKQTGGVSQKEKESIRSKVEERLRKKAQPDFYTVETVLDLTAGSLYIFSHSTEAVKEVCRLYKPIIGEATSGVPGAGLRQQTRAAVFFEPQGVIPAFVETDVIGDFERDFMTWLLKEVNKRGVIEIPARTDKMNRWEMGIDSDMQLERSGQEKGDKPQKIRLSGISLASSASAIAALADGYKPTHCRLMAGLSDSGESVFFNLHPLTLHPAKVKVANIKSIEDKVAFIRSLYGLLDSLVEKYVAARTDPKEWEKHVAEVRVLVAGLWQRSIGKMGASLETGTAGLIETKKRA